LDTGEYENVWIVDNDPRLDTRTVDLDKVIRFRSKKFFNDLWLFGSVKDKDGRIAMTAFNFIEIDRMTGKFSETGKFKKYNRYESVRCKKKEKKF
jgi:hypothetical protein